jgi:hypothetical protein
MTQSEEKVLTREIGKLAGFFGGFGARFMAKRLPVEECEASIIVAANVDDVRASVYEALNSAGRLTDAFASQATGDRLSAIVGSGYMNLNPTIVHVGLTESSQASTRISVRAIAKEGVVKQHSAAKAVERIRTLLANRHAEQVAGGDGE